MRSKARHIRSAVAWLAGLLLATPSWSAHAKPRSKPAKFVVVVHPSNQHKIDKEFLREVFLKRSEFWPDGTRVEPLDLGPGSTTRTHFSLEVLERPISAVRGYWNQRLFSGVAIPPAEYESEREIMAHVATHPGAIGYVSATTKLQGVRAVRLEGADSERAPRGKGSQQERDGGVRHVLGRE